jgi:hypothetical protein
MRTFGRVWSWRLGLALAMGVSFAGVGGGLPLPDGAPGLVQPRVASAIIDGTSNTVRNIGSPLAVDLSGRLAIVTGHVVCAPLGEVVTIQVQLTQPTTGAVAAGQTQTLCTGARATWVAQALAVGPGSLLPGTAQACALATGPTTRTSWCRAGGVTLVPAAGAAGGLLPGLPPPLLGAPPLPLLVPPPSAPWPLSTAPPAFAPGALPLDPSLSGWLLEQPRGDD